MGLWLAGLGTILAAVNFITTIICMRAPGMTMFRMPIFVWNTFVTSLLVLIAFPVLAGALLMLEADRQLGAHVFDAANGGAILWQHLFWFFGHPEVYIIALPFFGIISEILPVFSRKPVFGYIGLVGATISIAVLSVSVWAHHMFVTGAVDLAFFSGMSFLIAVPTGIKFFNWIGTMWGGSITFDTPMLWSMGFLTTFLFGGLTGVILASPPLDFHVTDSYFVVAHFHYVVFGTVVFAMFAGFYFWWPKMTGRMLDERLGKFHFWLLFVGFHTTFLVQHWLGVEGMPRRIADYLPDDGFTVLNQVSTVGAFILGASTLPFLYNVWISRRGPLVERDDPWGWGRSLEWATSSPPPRHNFVMIPRVRSDSPAFDLRHPTVSAVELAHNEAAREGRSPTPPTWRAARSSSANAAPSSTRKAQPMKGEGVERAAARVTSSVLFVSRLDRSIEFYRDVFSCTVTIREHDAALLLGPRRLPDLPDRTGDSAPSTPRAGSGSSTSSGPWTATPGCETLRKPFRTVSDGLDSYTSGGVSFLAAHDPDGIRILVAHPSPERLPRSVVGAHLYV